MLTIKLNRDKVALIDNQDWILVSQYKWFWNKARRNVYRNKKDKKSSFIHRLIMNPPNDMDVDHANGNPLDNRRSNLRICTRSQNNCNKAKQCNNTSGYKGVYWDKKNNKWRAKVSVNKRDYCMGRYKNIIDAVKAYNNGAKILHGKFARLLNAYQK